MRRRPVCILCMLLVVSVCDRLAGIFPDKGESAATVCADMDQKASGIHHLRGGGQVPGE